MKSFKAMMAEVAQPEPAEEKAFKAQHKVVDTKHPVALDTQFKGTKPKAKNKPDQEGDANYDLAYESANLDEVSVRNSDAAFKLETEISNLEKRIAKLTPLAPKDDDANMKLFSAKKSLKQKQDSLRGLMREAADTADADEMSMAMQQADFLAYVAKEMKSHLKAGKEFPEWMQNKLSKLQASAQDLHSNFGDHGGDEEDDMDEALKGDQHKIDHNKNGKIDGQDLAMIRAKKMKEQVELDEQNDDAHYARQSSKMQDAINLHLRKGKSYQQAVAAAKVHVKEEVEIDEALKGNQHKIDKNKNGKIDAHDFKLLKKEELEEGRVVVKTNAANMDDNAKHIEKLKSAGIDANQGAGSNGHIIVQDRDHEKAKKLLAAHLKEGESHQSKTTMKHISNPTAGEKKAAKDIKPGIKGVADRIAMLKSAQARGALKNEAADEALDEAFQQGIVKFKDGSSAVLKKEDADILNKLMGGMSSGSVKKMTETAMKDKNGFAEILAFAKEAT